MTNFIHLERLTKLAISDYDKKVIKFYCINSRTNDGDDMIVYNGKYNSYKHWKKNHWSGCTNSRPLLGSGTTWEQSMIRNGNHIT